MRGNAVTAGSGSGGGLWYSRAGLSCRQERVQVDHSSGLSASDIHVWRGDRAVLRGVSLRAGPGAIVHVQGPNGSGKTTLMRVLAGLSPPELGEVRWNDVPIRSQRDEFGSRTTYLGHSAALKGDLTAVENLCFGAGLKRRITPDDVAGALGRVGLGEQALLMARVLSAGQCRRLALARVLLDRTVLWLLDEPFTNLDSDGSQLLAQVLTEHADGGGIVVLASHQPVPVDPARVRTERLT